MITKLLCSTLIVVILSYNISFSQEHSQPIDNSNPADLLPFVQKVPKIDSLSLSKLIGLKYPSYLHDTNLLARHFVWKISKKPEYSVYEFVVDTLFIFFLEKCVKLNQNPKYSIMQIINILAVVNNDTDQIFEEVMCSKNNIVDDRIFALVKLPKSNKPVKYFTNIVRAWQVNTIKKRFDEISPNNIKCENEYFNSQEH